MEILKFEINYEMDVVLAHRRAMQLGKLAGMMVAEQTRFATAVSEICRNIVEYAKSGTITYSLHQKTEGNYLEALVKDTGPGIKELDLLLNRTPETHKGRGLGIVYAQRLSDFFDIRSSAEGTTVVIQKCLIQKKELLSKLIVDGWIKHLKEEPSVSAYEELKMRNSTLLELTDQLTANGKMVEKQMVEIQELNTRLSDSNKRMKDFTYAISHDLKNPLSSLKLASEHLSESIEEDNASLPFINLLSRSVNRLDKTIQSLIEILDIQNQESVARAINFEELIDEIKEGHAEIIEKTGATIETDLDSYSINYVEAYLRSILYNLVSNSIKYKSPVREPVIKIRTEQRGDNTLLTYTDNGLGIDMEKSGHQLFQPFHRIHKQGEGKGIGLYLIKGMVENNGGKMEVTSEAGYGTTFYVMLVPYKTL